MPPVNRNLNQRIKLALYSLKKDYGAEIVIYKLLSSTTDVTNGKKSIRVDRYRIRRAIVMPRITNRVAQQSISLISSNKEFVTGGTYDVGARDFIIDRRDVPHLPELSADDWIIYGRAKYQIKTVESFEVDAGWIVNAKELVGEVPELLVPAADTLAITHSATGVVNGS